MGTDADVIVVGAGPGGSATAHRLAQAGLDVLLLEKTGAVIVKGSTTVGTINGLRGAATFTGSAATTGARRTCRPTSRSSRPGACTARCTRWRARATRRYTP